MLIRALPAIRAQIPDAHYAIVGGGEELEHLRKLARDTGVADAVQFLTDVSDDQLVQCYQQCDLFALPNRAVGSDIEGFGMVLLEAQASGKPVLAGNSGGTAETMDLGRTGLVVDCTSPAPLAAAVLGLLSDPQRRGLMGEAARNWATSRFSWPACAKAADEAFWHSES
jgi:phosphatidylinositol alpha-1,6-mannosyltransferase